MSDQPVVRRPVFSRNAAKGVADLPEHVRRACMNVVRELASGAMRGKKLKGDLAELRSVRLGSTHRLLYRETADEIWIVDVGPRGDIYKR
jgi:mRNA-degrading endonuclease RelE of RelBE toxin-antitoxin system